MFHLLLRYILQEVSFDDTLGYQIESLNLSHGGNSMIRAIADAYRRAWNAGKILYHTAAFASLVILFALVATHRVSGYAQANLAYGQDDLAAQVQAANTPLPDQKQKKVASASPFPAEKPPVPPTPAQVK
jgi:hypothetical protein